MYYPSYRMRRLRRTAAIRDLVRETRLQLDDLVYPLFVIAGENIKNPISSMPGCYQLSIGNVLPEVREIVQLGIKAILLFGIPAHKDAAATGAYDGRWQQSLTNLRDKWGSRPGIVYIRFAHEMNGNWYPWSVNAGNKDAFVASWKRFRALQQSIFPAAKLVFSVNRESVGNGLDWRQSFPGPGSVDVLGVDYYNQYPYVGSVADWNRTATETDGYGAPKGLQRHLDFAASVGLPLALSEWNGNADNGDSTVWFQKMHDFLAAHGGSGAGQVLYECLFNTDTDNGRWALYPTGRMPNSAALYRSLW